MDSVEHGNLVGGNWEPSHGAGRFALRAALDRGHTVASYPRSDRRDVEHALAACTGRTWAETPPPARGEVLLEAARRLAADESWDAESAAVLGLERDEARTLCGDLVRTTAERVGGAAAGTPSAGPSLVGLDWRALLVDAWLDVVDELIRGRPVLFVADPRLPVVGRVVGEALVAAGLAPDALAVLHGPLEEVWSAAVGSGRLGALIGASSAERVAHLRHLSQGALADVRLRVPRTSAFEVAPDADPAQAARTAVDRAFGRLTTLGGQLGGQVARVFCPDRIHARFSAALLAELARHPATSRPVPQIDAEAEERARRAWALGLDEGATLIFGGAAAVGVESASPGPRRIPPTVFTNVEPHMEIARLAEPVPVLSLLRV